MKETTLNNTPQKPQGFVLQDHQAIWGTQEDTNLHIVLVAPEIPGNTGNIGRLCAGTNIWLHLVEPLAFELSNKFLRRAGLDYWPHVKLAKHESFQSIEDTFPADRIWLFTKHGEQIHADVSYQPGSVLVFGRETKGLAPEILEKYCDQRVRIPTTDKVRSLNLSNACAIACYEAMRQLEWMPLQG